MHRWGLCSTALLTLFLASAARADKYANGWRGNGTGLWPDSTAPTQWSRIPRGALDGLRSQAQRPTTTAPGDAPLVEKGQLRNWLVLGPFAVKDSVRDFDQESLKGEGAVEPSSEKVGDLAWKSAAAPADDITVFGAAELPWLDLAKVFGFQRNQIAYAHSYLYSPRGGPA